MAKGGFPRGGMGGSMNMQQMMMKAQQMPQLRKRLPAATVQ